MNRVQIILEGLGSAWRSPQGTALRGLGRILARRVWRLTVWLLWQIRLVWARLRGRTRVAVVLAVLVLLAAQTQSVAPSISATAHGLAVLLLAGVGLWLIATSPFRRRGL